jgi:putative oxidoreductase
MAIQMAVSRYNDVSADRPYAVVTPPSALVQRLLSGDTSDPVSQAGGAGLRITTGLLVLILHGWHKVVEGLDYVTTGADWPLVHDTAALGFPLPAMAAGLAAMSQFAGGVLLLIGAFTRVAAFFVASTMMTALVFNLRMGGPDAQLAGLYALVAAAFILIGGGRWSVDDALSRSAERGKR